MQGFVKDRDQSLNPIAFVVKTLKAFEQSDVNVIRLYNGFSVQLNTSKGLETFI